MTKCMRMNYRSLEQSQHIQQSSKVCSKGFYSNQVLHAWQVGLRLMGSTFLRGLHIPSCKNTIAMLSLPLTMWNQKTAVWENPVARS